MNQELDDELCKKYPKIFVNRCGSPKETLMFWGFECNDGWYKILDALCDNIQSHIDHSHKNREWDIKWNEEHPNNQRSVRDVVSQVVAVQIKEKFGGLRFYYDGGDDVIDGMVRIAESWASCTCEVCGNSGKLRHGGWIKTLCDEHEEQRQKKRKEKFE